MRMSLALDLGPLRPWLTGGVGLIAALGTKNEGERLRNRAVYGKLLDFHGGAVTVVGDPFRGVLRTVARLRDADGYRALMQEDGYREAIAWLGGLGGLARIEFEPNAFAHRDVGVLAQTLQSDIALPSMPTGGKRTYTAVAGDFLLGATALGRDAMTAMIDAALDGRIGKVAAADGVLLEVEAKFGELLDKAGAFGNSYAAAPNRAADRVHATFGTTDDSFHIHIRFPR
jgi:hypothetical protein